MGGSREEQLLLRRPKSCWALNYRSSKTAEQLLVSHPLNKQRLSLQLIEVVDF
ncbi:hypothetical protein fugu_010961 [Takifugu bimaculatus]|uniref:Uncharacterized protein n=1 Tax=Takifugu bimaculatus TaxID=433685 RepID=A0A4Z2CBL8_9TELE|nr:hypothetical protein fugu_010961 [Takifugu bimaculatus]